MKRVKCLIIMMLIIVFIPINTVSAETYTIESNISTNGKHYYIPTDIPLPASNIINVIEEENSIENYLVDYNDNKWNLYTVSLEVFSDGTSEAFDNLKTKLNNNSYSSLSYSTLTSTSEESYLINGKNYTPEIDTLILAMGDEISIKSIGNETFNEDEYSGWTIFIQYSINRYKTIDELNECIDSKDSNESNMRRGIIQISMFYPSGESIDTYYTEGSFNDYRDINTELNENIINNLGNQYDKDVDDKGNTIIKDVNGNEVLEISTLQNNQVTITIKNDSLKEEDIKELLTDVASLMISSDIEDVVVRSNEDGTLTVTNTEESEIIKISKIEGNKVVLTIDKTNKDIVHKPQIETNNNISENNTLNNNSMVKMLVLFGVVIIFTIVVVIYTLLIVNKKKKR